MAEHQGGQLQAISSMESVYFIRQLFPAAQARKTPWDLLNRGHRKAVYGSGGAGEMARGLRALAALPEDPGLIPCTYIIHNHLLTLVPGDLMPSSGLLGHQEHTQYTDIHVSKFPTHINSK